MLVSWDDMGGLGCVIGGLGAVMQVPWGRHGGHGDVMQVPWSCQVGALGVIWEDLALGRPWQQLKYLAGDVGE